METFEIHIREPGKNLFLMNGIPLTQYSEFAAFFNRPLEEWCESLFGMILEEVNYVDFELKLIGSDFEKYLLEAMMAECKYCKEFHFEKAEYAKEVSTLSAKIDALPSSLRSPLKFWNDVALNDTYVEHVDFDDAVLYISDDDSYYQYIEDLEGFRVFLVASDDQPHFQMKNQKILWYVSKKQAVQIAQSMIEYFVKFPLIAYAKSNSVQSNEVHTSSAQNLPQTARETLPSIPKIPSIEKGYTYTIQVPKAIGTSKDVIVVKSEFADIIEVSGYTLRGISAGVGKISFFRQNEIAPFAAQEVEVFETNYITAIELSTSDERVPVGATGRIRAVYSPSDAEDAHELTFESLNPNILSIDRDGYFRTHAPGRANITAKSRRASQDILVTVLPNVSDVEIEADLSYFYVGDTRQVLVKLHPDNCYSREYDLFSDDRAVARVERASGDYWRVYANSIGSCNLVCRAANGVERRIPFTVDNSFRRREQERKHPLCFVSILMSALAVLFAVKTNLLLTALFAALGIVFGSIAIAKKHLSKEEKRNRRMEISLSVRRSNAILSAISIFVSIVAFVFNLLSQIK